MVELVIKIPEVQYNTIKSVLYNTFPAEMKEWGLDAIREGTPLPKGHGKIVDIGKIEEDRIDDDNPIIYLTIDGNYIEAVNLDYLNNLPAIIEADTESEE